MQQDPQIIPLHIPGAAYIVFRPVFEEDEAKYLAILEGKLVKYLSHAAFTFFSHQAALRIQIGPGRIEPVLGHRGVSRYRAVILCLHIITDGVHKGAEPLRVRETSLVSQLMKNTQEGLLANILHGLI